MEKLTLEVANRGHGILAGVLDDDGHTGSGVGVGIAGMRDRLTQLRGEVSIISTRKGTTARATLGADRLDRDQAPAKL